MEIFLDRMDGILTEPCLFKFVTCLMTNINLTVSGFMTEAAGQWTGVAIPISIFLAVN